MKRRSKHCKIIVEEISNISVKFLKVREWKDGSHFVTSPKFKPTSLWQLLRVDSAHAPHCHTSWPAARLTLSRALSGNPSIFQKAKQELVSGSSRILHLSLLSQTSNAPTVSQQSDVVLNVTECGLSFSPCYL